MSDHRQSGINRPFSWLKKVLQITEKTVAPDTLLSGVNPTVDVFGWERFLPERAVTTAAGSTTTTRLLPVPEGEAHLFLACDISHDDPIGSKDMSLQYENELGNQVALERTAGLNANFFITLTRPILVTAGNNLMGVSRNAIAVGSNFIIRGMFIRLEPGEYLYGSPFG